MRLTTLFAACLAALSVAAPAWAQAPGFAITGVCVFDGEKVVPKATVVVQGGRVTAIGPNAKVPAGLAVVDGAGKTLLPGLIDAHTHSFGPARADAIRFGVTTELDMFTHPSTLEGLKADREGLAQTNQSDLYSAGILATAPKGHGTEYGFEIPVLTQPSEADAWVAARIAEGSDYIKLVYAIGPRTRPSIDKDTMAAVVAAAHKRGKLAVAHIQTTQDALTAIEAGIDGLVHIYADTAPDTAFYALAAKRKVFVIPTLSVLSGFSGSGEGAKLADDPRIKPLLTPEQAQQMRTPVRTTAFKMDVANGGVAALKAAKIDVLAGTDAGNPTTAHGATLHQEMALLVRAGLSPTEALRAATSLPARRFGLKDRGHVKVGERADLVLVDGDPTTTIEDTRAIAAVWKNGYPVDRKPPAPPTGKPLAGVLGNFEAGLAGPDGTAWTATSDRFAGGASEARASRTEGGAIRAEGEIKPPFPFAWGGVQLMLSSPTAAPRDISGVTALVFRVRGQGSGPQGRAMLFDTAGPQPRQRSFAFSADWSEVRIPIADFAGLNTKAVVGLVISTDPTKGPFAFEVDDVRLE
jgi:imidazolonepropionase-like amidohydrolase